ncbi:Protein Mo25 [Zea mays]|jgi:hypothetical protein|uniref:Protein Mo25 n=1 Tax=Zea mays TaxID=4577 RepID=A0A1D6F2K0_MAIZE|nr:Protein Mo25 [Zea mays]
MMKGRSRAVVRAVSLTHQVTALRVQSSLSVFAGERLVTVYPFSRSCSCGSGSLWHCVCPFLSSEMNGGCYYHDT